MRFCFKLGLVLVTSDCGITADCYVDRSVNTNTAHACAFYETKTVCKNAKFHAYTLFLAQTVIISVATAGDFSLGSGVFLFHLGFWGFY